MNNSVTHLQEDGFVLSAAGLPLLKHLEFRTLLHSMVVESSYWLYYFGINIWLYHDYRETAIGRMTGKSPVGAFASFSDKR